MRLACCVSSLLSSRSASAENSIFQAMALHDIFQRNRAFFTAPYALQGPLRQVQPFEILKMFPERSPHLLALHPPMSQLQLSKSPLHARCKSADQPVTFAMRVHAS